MSGVSDRCILLFVEITSCSTPGPRLDAALLELRNNVYGNIVGALTPEDLAHSFLQAGWWARKSSRTTYEVGHSWAEIEFFQHDGVTSFAGVVNPEQVTLLADTFGKLGLNCSIELWDPEGQGILQEFHVEGGNSAHPE
jgi:hypothetical protein